MSTSKIVTREVDQFMANTYKPVYQPILPLFLPNSIEYAQEVGILNLKSVETVGDIRAKMRTPKDTNIQQVNFKEGSKSFKKYFFANQFKIDHTQDDAGVDDVIAQVLDEHWKQADELLLLGEGTAGNNVVNNALFWSGDSNYDLNNSAAVAAGTAADHLSDLHSKIIATKLEMDTVAGKKIIILYGSTMMSKVSQLFSSAPTPFLEVLQKSLGTNYNIVLLPSQVTPSGANGWIGVNMDQIKLHYAKLPSLFKSGANDENGYDWYNFLLGSMMLEVKAAGAINRQPVTFA